MARSQSGVVHHQRLQALRVDRLERLLLHDSEDFLWRHCVTIRPLGREGVINVRDCEDAHLQGELLRIQMAEVSGAIQLFVVRACDLAQLLETWNPTKDFDEIPFQ